MAHRRRASLAVTPSLHDLRDLANLLSHLAGPIDGAKYGGDVHGGTAGLDYGGTPMGAIVARTNATPSITELQRSYLAP